MFCDGRNHLFLNRNQKFPRRQILQLGVRSIVIKYHYRLLIVSLERGGDSRDGSTPRVNLLGSPPSSAIEYDPTKMGEHDYVNTSEQYTNGIDSRPFGAARRPRRRLRPHDPRRDERRTENSEGVNEADGKLLGDRLSADQQPSRERSPYRVCTVRGGRLSYDCLRSDSGQGTCADRRERDRRFGLEGRRLTAVSIGRFGRFRSKGRPFGG